MPVGPAHVGRENRDTLLPAVGSSDIPTFGTEEQNIKKLMNVFTNQRLDFSIDRRACMCALVNVDWCRDLIFDVSFLDSLLVCS